MLEHGVIIQRFCMYMAQAIMHPWKRPYVIFGQGLEEMRFCREAFLSVVNIVQVGGNVKRTCAAFFLSFLILSCNCWSDRGVLRRGNGLKE